MAPTTPCPQGPQEPVFNIIKCDVPCIFPIPNGDWIPNPQVPQAPGDIADCPSVPIPLLEPEPLCPEILFNNSPIGGVVQTSVVPIGQESASFQITKGECCNYNFDMDIEFPCPQLTSSSQSQGQAEASIGYVSPCNSAPYAKLVITPVGTCSYN